MDFGLALRDQERLRGAIASVSTSTAVALPSGPQPGDVFGVCRETEAGTVRLDDRPWAEGAALVAELATGRVLALVGGHTPRLEGFDRATQARRQPGSAFKPVVYAAALERGRTQASPVWDGPLSLPGARGRVWSPKNYDGRFRGQVSLRTALAQSLNTPAVRLALDAGIPQVLDVARRLGITTPLRPDPTVALGASEVTLADLVRAYGTIGRAGAPMMLSFIDAIEDVRGDVVSRPGSSNPGWPPLPGRSGPRALDEGLAAELTDMLREVVATGTARRAARPGQDRAGKTGTTNDNVDAWFIGFDPRYVVGVWIGTDGHASLGDAETGGKAALPAWMDIMEALATPAGLRLPVPDGARVETGPDGQVRVYARGRGPLDFDVREPLPPVSGSGGPRQYSPDSGER